MEIDNQRVTQAILKIHHDEIVQDIQGDVIWALFEKQVLTEKDYQYIKSQNDREKEAHSLLELLPNKGFNGFNQFLNYLSTYYSWIADPILSSIKNEYNDMFPTKIHQALTFGEVPQLSSRHVSRTKHVKTLKDLLKKLEAGNFVVVNGMTGCGKSSLVIEVLNDPLITMQYFQGSVHWLNVGRENSSDIGCVQTELLNRLNYHKQHIMPPLNTDFKATRKTLQELWKQKYSTGGLLILDDVCSNQIVKYLDIECKILITTHDKSIMDDIIDTRVKYVKVNEGFEENETLDLFSKCLSVDFKSLPSHALKLHNICKGFPLTISLIGAQLEAHKEETINNMDRWTFYLEELSDRTSYPFKYTPPSHKQFKSLEKAIEMCIQSLPKDLQNNYRDFSLFVDDLNIKPEVLSVLWNLKKIQVEDIMLELMRKSLVVRAWNQPLNSYVYSIHDLLLCNLKKSISSHDSKMLHRKLIERYSATCNGNFVQLPKNDNYIFLYFGYHLKNADLLEEFPKWFFNLKFLEAKISVTGPADLLTDFKKYRKYIVVHNTHEEYIKEIECFIISIGPYLYQTKCDIIQLGLQEPTSSFVYKTSYKIAKSSGKPYFYYKIRPSLSCLPKPHISIVRDVIETVIFGNRYDEVIIATNNGHIKAWNIIAHKCLYTYYGHTARVTHLAKNKQKNFFLSTSDDSTIRIWSINSFPGSDNPETRTPSPETRQEHWQNVFNVNYKKSTDITDCVILDHHSGPVIFAQFSSDDKLVVSSSTDKTLKIWKLDNGTVLKTINQTSIIYKCYFMKTTTSDCILFSTQSETGSVIYRCQWPFDHCTGLLYLKEKLLSFFSSPSTEGDYNLLILTQENVACYKFDWDKSVRIMDYPKPIGYERFKLFSISEEHMNKTNNTRFIALSLNNCTIQICDLWTGYNFLDLNDPVQGILNLDWFWSNTDQSNWLLCAAEDKSIRLWCLNDITKYTCSHKIDSKHHSNNSDFKNLCKNEIISLQNYKSFTEEQNVYCYKFKQNFDAAWLDNGSILIATITKCGTLKVLFEGLNHWSIIDKRVTALSIINSEPKFDQTMIIVACEDLSVHMLKHQASTFLFNTNEKVDQIFACCDHGQLIIVLLLNVDIKENEPFNQTVQIWINEEKFLLNVQNVIDCYVFHDKIILLYNVHEMLIIDNYAKVNMKLEVNCIKINGSLMLDHTKLAVNNNGNTLNIFKLMSDYTLNLLDQYQLPFKESEMTSISISNDKNLIVVGGQKYIVLIDQILKTTKHFITDSCINNIQSLKWSSDDTRLAIKEDNQIITFDVESGKKIASIRLTADTFSVDSTLNTYISVNTAGQLVVLNLSNNIHS